MGSSNGSPAGSQPRLIEAPRPRLAGGHEQPQLGEAALTRRFESGAMEVAGQPRAPVVAADEEVGDVPERRVVDGMRRACCRQDGDLADQVASGVRDETAHIFVGQRLAQMLDLSLERRRGPARRRERRVVLDALENTSGQRLGVGDGRSAKADRVITRHVAQYLAARQWWRSRHLGCLS